MVRGMAAGQSKVALGQVLVKVHVVAVQEHHSTAAFTP
jgi:hypothetical protein